MIDFAGETPLPDTDALGDIAAMVATMLALDKEIVAKAKELKDLTERRRKVAEDDIPTAMEGAGVLGLTMGDGRQLSVKESLYASIPKDNKKEAAQWLDANGYGSLVKTSVLVQFDRGDGDKARELAAELKAKKLTPMVAEDMNTASVKAAIKEMRENGIPVPMQLFGAYIQKEAVVK
jgi:hypothetical protein